MNYTTQILLLIIFCLGFIVIAHLNSSAPFPESINVLFSDYPMIRPILKVLGGVFIFLHISQVWKKRRSE